MSPWLIGTLIVTALLYFVLLIAPDRHANGADFTRAYSTSVRAKYGHGPSILDATISLPLVAFLVWFSYFSKSELVKDHDRFVVFLMLCGAALGLVLTAIRHFIHLF